MNNLKRFISSILVFVMVMSIMPPFTYNYATEGSQTTEEASVTDPSFTLSSISVNEGESITVAFDYGNNTTRDYYLCIYNEGEAYGAGMGTFSPTHKIELNAAESITLPQLSAGNYYAILLDSSSQYYCQTAFIVNDTAKTADLYVEDIECFVGETITVPIILNNNNEIDSITLDVYFDSAVLAPVEVLNGTLCDAFTSTLSSTSSYNITWNDSISGTGQLAQLKFNVLNSAVLGDTVIEISTSDETISTENGIVKVKDTGLKLDGTTLSISSNIAIKYMLNKKLFDNAGYTNPKLEATYANNTIELSPVLTTVGGVEYYSFVFENVAPQMMNDVISSVLKASKDGTVYSSMTKEYSAAIYAYSQLSKTTDIYFRTLLVDMLNYGSKAQIYTNYNIDNLSNSNLTEEQKKYATQDLRALNTVKNLSQSSSDDTAFWIGMGLYLNNQVAIRGYFSADSINGVTVRVTDEQNNILANISENSFTASTQPDGTPLYSFIYNGLNASQMSKTVMFTIHDSNNNKISSTYTYSIESYVYTAKDSSVTELAELTKAMIKYGDAAAAYLNSRSSMLGSMTMTDIGDVAYARIINNSTDTALALTEENEILTESSADIAQIWRFDKDSSGAYTITNQALGNKLTLDESSDNKWYLYTDGENYAFVPTASKTKLLTTEDNTICLKAYNETQNYKFTLLNLNIENNRENVVWYTTPAIPADAGETVYLDEYHVQFTSNGSLTPSSKITWTSSDLSITDGKVTIPSKGVFKLTASIPSENISKNIYLVAKNASESEYVLYYNDFNTNDLSELNIVNNTGSVSVSNGKLQLSGKEIVLLPDYISDFANYTIHSDSTMTAANDETRWMGYMYRADQNLANYYQFSIRKNAAIERGIELVERLTSGSWSYQAVGSYTEAINSSKLYNNKIMVYEDYVKAYINNTLLMVGSGLSHKTGMVGIQASDVTAVFDYIMVTLDFDIIYDYTRLAQLYSNEHVDLGDDFNAVITETKVGKAVDVSSSNNVYINTASQSSSQTWRFYKNNDGSYRICNLSNNLYLSTVNSLGLAGTNVIVRGYTASQDQHWFVYKDNNHYMLVPSCAYDVSLDLAAGNTADGNTIQLWTYNDDDDDAKRFIITKTYKTEYAEHINYRNYLVNTNKKLQEDKELSVLFYGGSLTEGHGSTDKAAYSWRGRTCQWFESNFPNVNFNFINKAVGESGTFLGTYRLKMDVIDAKPDLMFLEYSINDRYFGSSYDEAFMRCETIVREIKAALPDTDIIILITTDRDCLADNQKGNLHTQGKAHEAVAAAYDIPSLHIGMVLAEKCGYSKDVFNTYAIDVVHLNDAGYEIYFACVEEYLENSLLATDFSKVSNPVKTYPMVSSELFDGNRLHIQPSQAILESSEMLGGKGVELLDSYYTANSSSKGVFLLRDVGDELVFKFNGTEIAMWCTLINGQCLVSVDGEAYKTIYTNAHNPAVIAQNLASKEHIVRIKVSDSNYAFNIGALFTRDATLATKK